MTEDKKSVEQLENELAALKAAGAKVNDPDLTDAFNDGAGIVTPEDVAATALDESDDAGYDGITPAADPDEPVEDEEEPDPDAMTAFIVVMQADGSASISTDLSLKLTVLREANLLDVRRACDEIRFNLGNQAVSETTVMLMHQTGQQLAEQARIQKVQQKLASKGIHVPGARG